MENVGFAVSGELEISEIPDWIRRGVVFHLAL
jgi:hypothetical protein